MENNLMCGARPEQNGDLAFITGELDVDQGMTHQNQFLEDDKVALPLLQAGVEDWQPDGLEAALLSHESTPPLAVAQGAGRYMLTGASR